MEQREGCKDERGGGGTKEEVDIEGLEGEAAESGEQAVRRGMGCGRRTVIDIERVSEGRRVGQSEQRDQPWRPQLRRRWRRWWWWNSPHDHGHLHVRPGRRRALLTHLLGLFSLKGETNGRRLGGLVRWLVGLEGLRGMVGTIGYFWYLVLFNFMNHVETELHAWLIARTCCFSSLLDVCILIQAYAQLIES